MTMTSLAELDMRQIQYVSLPAGLPTGQHTGVAVYSLVQNGFFRGDTLLR